MGRVEDSEERRRWRELLARSSVGEETWDAETRRRRCSSPLISHTPSADIPVGTYRTVCMGCDRAIVLTGGVWELARPE